MTNYLPYSGKLQYLCAIYGGKSLPGVPPGRNVDGLNVLLLAFTDAFDLFERLL
jgi:hypothetical protein